MLQEILITLRNSTKFPKQNQLDATFLFFRYFVAHILQFQFLKSLCIAAGEYDPQNPSIPLHKCDFYESIEAGDRLK